MGLRLQGGQLYQHHGSPPGSRVGFCNFPQPGGIARGGLLKIKGGEGNRENLGREGLVSRLLPNGGMEGPAGGDPLRAAAERFGVGFKGPAGKQVRSHRRGQAEGQRSLQVLPPHLEGKAAGRERGGPKATEAFSPPPFFRLGPV